MGGAPALGLGGVLTIPHPKKKQQVTKCYTGPQTWTDSLKL
jgi:hypothetical protein